MPKDQKITLVVNGSWDEQLTTMRRMQDELFDIERDPLPVLAENLGVLQHGNMRFIFATPDQFYRIRCRYFHNTIIHESPTLLNHPDYSEFMRIIKLKTLPPTPSNG